MDTPPTDGFVRLPNWLIDESDLTLHELAVYIVLLRFRDHRTGKCFPGISSIADRARISTKSVHRAIKGLEDRHMIRVERRSTVTENRPNVYTVAFAADTKPADNSARGKRVPKRTRPTTSDPRDSESLPTDSQSLPPGTPSPPNKNQKNKNHKQALRAHRI